MAATGMVCKAFDLLKTYRTLLQRLLVTFHFYHLSFETDCLCPNTLDTLDTDTLDTLFTFTTLHLYFLITVKKNLFMILFLLASLLSQADDLGDIEEWVVRASIVWSNHSSSPQ